MSKTDVKNDSRSLLFQRRLPYCIAMILSQTLSFQIRWLDPVPEIKWIFLRIKLNEYIRIKLNEYMRIKLNEYIRIKLNEYIRIKLNEYIQIKLNEYIQIKLNGY